VQVQVQQVQQRRVQSAECSSSGTVGSGHWDESAVECSAAGALARQGKGGGFKVEVSAHAFLATRALY
jgi:hypothetical protein